MFGIQWGYALCNFLAFVMIYIYIGQFNPGVFPGMYSFGRCVCKTLVISSGPMNKNGAARFKLNIITSVKKLRQKCARLLKTMQ